MPTTSFALLLTLYSVQTLPAPLTPCNNATQFDCRTISDSKRCIPLEWLCDGLKDCKNGLDESHCSYPHKCPTGDFICRTGECVSGRYKCDGEADCPGAEDERSCDYLDKVAAAASAIMMNCPEHTFHCDLGPCVARKYVCDGEEDCPLGDDEHNCTKNKQSELRNHELTSCEPGMFLCADHAACFPKNWVCDGEKDCLDGSDEENCELSVDNFLAETVTELCKAGEHRCSGGKICISSNHTCDGTIDCPDGDDEGPLCSECSTREVQCEYKCVNTPMASISGSHCICPHGSKLSSNEHTCSQINECETPEAKHCQHYCEDRHASYKCTCAPGYSLGLDAHSCRLDRTHEGTLFVALGHEVRSIPLFGSRTPVAGNETIQAVGSLGVARSVDFHISEQLVYMTIAGPNLNGEVAVSSKGLLRVIRENVAGIGQVAVDWVGGNIFLSQRYPSLTPGISVCTEDGFFCRRIIRGKPADPIDQRKNQQYRGLALHPQRGAMVWIESYGGYHEIVTANMNGTNVRNLVENELDYPTGLSIDFIRSDIYFGDVERQMIERVNMDTRERAVVLTQGVHHPYDIRYFNGFLYWTDWVTSALKVSELSIHHQSAHSMHSFTTLPYGLAINHSMFQPSSSNPCLESGCSHMCVPIPNAEGEVTSQCLCPDGYEKEKNGECVPLGAFFDEDEHGKLSMQKNELEDQSHVSVAWMKERCLEGDGCLNGGQCHDIKNEHGRVIKIVCKCKIPYEGLRCERFNPVKAIAAQLRLSAIKFWMICFIILIMVIFFIAVFVFSCRHIHKKIKRASSPASIEKTVKCTSIISNPLFDEDQLSCEAKEEPVADTLTRNPAISAKSGRIGSDLDVSKRIVEHQYCTIGGY